MARTVGSHHLATLTADLDRLIDFSTQIFDATVVFDLREGGMRHAFLDLGGGFALRAATDDLFWDLRERIYQAGPAMDRSPTSGRC
jgi:catechol 2,3-dioxygenase-like lactoylglutathione lyase family enzyme